MGRVDLCCVDEKNRFWVNGEVLQEKTNFVKSPCWLSGVDAVMKKTGLNSVACSFFVELSGRVREYYRQ